MLDNIFIFVKLVELGSFVKTAHYFKTTKSTISRKIQSLEEYLDKPILIRNSKKIEMTTNGEYLYAKFKHLHSVMNDTIKYFYPANDKISTELTVSLPTILSKAWITPYLSFFMRQNPQIRLNIIYQHNKVDLENVDLAVTTLYDDIASDIYDFRFIITEYIQLYCTQEYAQKYGIPLTIDELESHAFIGAVDPKTYKAIYTATLTHKHTKEKVILNVAHAKLKINLADHVLDIGSQNEHVFWGRGYECEKLVRAGKLINVLPDLIYESQSFYIVSRKSISTQEQLFIDFIYRCINKKIELDMQNTGLEVINEDY